jgi:glycosyltransferase involved in cell wall biosynthesis
MPTRRILMIAYHFPPLAGSSGIQRTLRFVQHLPASGWQPLVLTARSVAYERTSPDLDADVPAQTVVRRALALDTARHLSLAGRYVAAMARPDRWVSWRFDAVRQGMKLIRKYQPDILWSTYPIATAHLIGAELHRRSGLPWVADFRDPMAQHGYPADPLTWQQYDAIERHAVLTAAASVFTTPGAARMYRNRYPAGAARVHVLENGYDEESFSAAQDSAAVHAPLNPGAVTLLHSGIIYPQERDPTQLMAALAHLSAAGIIQPGTFKIRFRAAVQEDLLRKLAAEFGVMDFIEIVPPVGYKEALREMLRADALLVMQAGDCNEQIPAKLYEYLRAGRPIICLSDPEGDTIGLLRAAGLNTFARIDDARDIASLLQRLCADPAGSVLASEAFVRAASRAARAAELAALLDEIAASKEISEALAR